MLHGTTIRTAAVAVVGALVLAGCGLVAGGTPVVTTQDGVVDALLALQDGARARGTAELTVDEGELRRVLRNDPEALALLRRLADHEDVEDPDALVAELTEAQAELARQAVLLEVGADRSARVAAEQDGTVWADLRTGGFPSSDSGDVDVELQLQVDWATAAQVLREPDLLAGVDGAMAALRGLGGTPETAALTEVATAFLAGELVGISGALSPALLAPFDRGAGAALRELHAELTPRELLRTAFTFDDFRRDGDDTLVDVTLELHAIGEQVLDTLGATSAAGRSFEDVERARAELADLPERLTDVATVRLDTGGTVTEVRVDLLDIGLQLARATEDDAELATARRVAEQLETSGMFLVLAVTDVGAVPTVLGEPTTSVTPDEVVRAVGALFLGRLGGVGELDRGALADPRDG